MHFELRASVESPRMTQVFENSAAFLRAALLKAFETLH